MNSVGDLFPDDFKSGFAKRKVVPGSVIKAFVKDTNPPKEKRFIVVAFDKSRVLLASVYINSKINPKIFNSSELQALHIPLKSQGREYLDHDSYVDCSSIYEKETQSIIEIIKSRPAAVIGELSTADFALIKSTLRNAKTISTALKKKFGLI